MQFERNLGPAQDYLPIQRPKTKRIILIIKRLALSRRKKGVLP